jgi:lysozyme
MSKFINLLILIFTLLILNFPVKAQLTYYNLDSMVKCKEEAYYKVSIISLDSIPNIFREIEVTDTTNFQIDTLFNYLQGLDCSVWQDNIKWDVIDTVYKFIFIRASESLKYDKKFIDNWKHCHITKGAYHFFNPNVNGIIQAKHFLSIVKLEKGNLPPVIDVEYCSYWRRCNKYTGAKNLRLMLEYIEHHTGVKPIIYTNCNFWNKYLANYVIFKPSDYPLWIAHYYVNSPNIPKGWNTWTFWQYSAKGRMHKHYTDWDLNYFNGDDLNDILIK